MRLFSRFVFICNSCFLIAILLRFAEISNKAQGNYDLPLDAQPVIATVLVLYFISVFLNALFLSFVLYAWYAGKIGLFPKWIWIFNVLLFPFQLYYIFYSQS